MRKFWLVCWNEYRRHVLRKRFLIVILSPVLMMGLFGVILVVAMFAQLDRRPLGYVDRSGMFAHAKDASTGSSFSITARMIAFPDETAARKALDTRRIQGYYVIRPSYPVDAAVDLVAEKPLGQGADGAFDAFVRANLVAGKPPQVARRLLNGTTITARVPEHAQETKAGSDWIRLLVPLAAGMMFVFVINTSGGYLLQAVVDEKENRTMEIIITSVSANQLMAGKVVGNLSVGLTQLLIWTGLPGALILAAGSRIPFLATALEPKFLLLLALTMIPAFVMISALMAAIGSTATESREAQQVSTMFSLPIMAPYWLFAPILAHPNGALARGLSYFPLSAPVTLTMRAAITTLPAWEVALNLAILYVTAGLALWLAGRVFRLGMLRYGQPLSLRDLLPAAWARHSLPRLRKAQP